MVWSAEHEEICCEIYLNEILKKQSFSGDVKNRCVALAKERGVPHLDGSIKMKFQNIKAICDLKGIKHVSPFMPMQHYSLKNLQAFEKVFASYIEKTNMK